VLAGLVSLLSACGGSRTDAPSSEPHYRVGDVVLLADDPEPPSLDATLAVITLSSADHEVLCDWVRSLSRPALEECPDGYYSIYALHLACATIDAQSRPTCAATVEDMAACSMQVLDCSTGVDSLGECSAVHAPDCRPDVPAD
jgi:hypothetical protein